MDIEKPFATLLKRAKYNPKKITRTYGDYVNNGPDSFGTLKLVKRLKRRGAIALAGNHEMRWLNSKIKRLSVGMRSYVNYLLLK